MRIAAFTLIELLIVIAIIGLLSLTITAATGNARKKARDSRRIADLKTIQTALELYYDDHGDYPPSPCGYNCTGYYYSYITTADASPTNAWSILESYLAEYLPGGTLPIDPYHSSPRCPPWNVSGACRGYVYGNVYATSHATGEQYDLVAGSETISHEQACVNRNWRYSYDNRPWCVSHGGVYSDQLYEGSR